MAFSNDVVPTRPAPADSLRRFPPFWLT